MEQIVKKKLLVILLHIFFLIWISGAIQASVGVGIIVGDPKGLTIKIKNFPIFEVDWEFEHHFRVHCDYWVKTKKLDNEIYVFAGVGVKLIFREKENEKVDIGLRIPLGLSYYLSKNLEFFGELVPGMQLIPGTKFDIDGGIGVRYYIGKKK